MAANERVASALHRFADSLAPAPVPAPSAEPQWPTLADATTCEDPDPDPTPVVPESLTLTAEMAPGSAAWLTTMLLNRQQVAETPAPARRLRIPDELEMEIIKKMFAMLLLVVAVFGTLAYLQDPAIFGDALRALVTWLRSILLG